jgi:hypothetical protein
MKTSPPSPRQPPLLTEATVQEIQLELIRRTRFNAFDGPRIVASLLAHRNLWEAVILDRFGLQGYGRAGGLPVSGLIKLRDLSGNFWNADKLFILTRDAASAHRLAKIIEKEEWGGEEPRVYDDDEEVGSALGGSDPGQSIVTVWWD